jgi:uncharacterized protein YbjT (DUF2867 family)
MKNVLVAGATGYLGNFLLKELKNQDNYTIALARNTNKLDDISPYIDKIIQADVTLPESLNDSCNNVDIVISSIGITRQKDGLTYMDVDYQANVNLLNKAKKAGVKKFIYISVLNVQLMTNLKIIQAKLLFEDELKSSGINYMIIRPNGFFSDLTELLNMAKKGTVYLFGDGEFKSNPIHGADLAEFIVQKLDSSETILDIGGPDLLTQNQIAQSAFSAVGKKVKILFIPLWIKNISLKLVRWFSGQKTYGPIEFFLTVMTMDMLAPQFGNHNLSDYYKEIARS